jgi:hypothetical protein
MEGVLISLMNKKPEETTPQDYLDLLQQLDWAPAVMELNP